MSLPPAPQSAPDYPGSKNWRAVPRSFWLMYACLLSVPIAALLSPFIDRWHNDGVTALYNLVFGAALLGLGLLVPWVTIQQIVRGIQGKPALMIVGGESGSDKIWEKDVAMKAVLLAFYGFLAAVSLWLDYVSFVEPLMSKLLEHR